MLWVLIKFLHSQIFVKSQISVIFTPTHPQSFSTDGDVQLSFHKNGRFIGVAFSLAATVMRGRPLFPHVCCKSCSVRFHLDPTALPWYPCPPGFMLLAALPARQRVRATSAPSSIAQCEVSDSSCLCQIPCIFITLNPLSLLPGVAVGGSSWFWEEPLVQDSHEATSRETVQGPRNGGAAHLHDRESHLQAALECFQKCFEHSKMFPTNVCRVVDRETSSCDRLPSV